MKKNILNLITIIFGIFIIGVIIIGFYSLFAIIDERSQISKLEKYTMLSTEKSLKEFNYERKKYVISIYYDDTSSWGNLNILLKIKDSYYRLEEIKKCDGSSGRNILVKDNKIYIHCIGKRGDILEYKINGTTVERNIMYLNYDNTPNISQFHIGISKIDNSYIYLESIKINNLIQDGEKVKCLLKSNICYYY